MEDRNSITVTLEFINGTDDGPVTAKLGYLWNATAIRIPRKEVSRCDTPLLTEKGIYFLFYKEKDLDCVYIGESLNVKDRLKQHLNDKFRDKEWIAVAFVSNELDGDSRKYLENTIVERAKSAKRFTVHTGRTNKNIAIKGGKQKDLTVFIDNVKLLTKIFGYLLLDPLVTKKTKEKTQYKNTRKINNIFYFNGKDYDAKGYIVSDGFVVTRGSKIREGVAPSAGNQTKELRKKYINEGKIKDSYTTEDIWFKSASAAARFVTGWSENGRERWKDESGRSLGEIEGKS